MGRVRGAKRWKPPSKPTLPAPGPLDTLEHEDSATDLRERRSTTAARRAMQPLQIGLVQHRDDNMGLPVIEGHDPYTCTEHCFTDKVAATLRAFTSKQGGSMGITHAHQH